MLFNDVIAVGTSPVNLMPEVDMDRPVEVHVFANGCFIGGPNVSVSNGIPVPTNQTLVFHVNGEHLFAVSTDAASARVLVLGQ